jgi:hypothetical protein
MRVSEVLDFDDYYRDPQFALKKARPGSWKDRCGDNMYHLNKAGRWVQARAYFHKEQEEIDKDLEHPYVFISDHFFYFGESAPVMPVKNASLIRIGRGCKYHNNEAIIEAFVNWLERTYEAGIIGQPRDREEAADEPCGLLKKGRC